MTRTTAQATARPGWRSGTGGPGIRPAIGSVSLRSLGHDLALMVALSDAEPFLIVSSPLLRSVAASRRTLRRASPLLFVDDCRSGLLRVQLPFVVDLGI